VGRADDFHKRPQLCLELARRLPHVPFLMVLNPHDERIAAEIERERPANVSIVGSVPFAEMSALLTAARLYVSTGSAAYEGSPNIFLQAGASHTPVGSLEVPPILPCETDAGFFANGNLDRLADWIAQVWSDEERTRRAGEAARRYVEKHHQPAAVIPRLAEMLRDLKA
jgi:glycosyltransferase involved in cell wall biosynthesis